MRTGTITGNGGGEYEVILGLKKGDKLFCHTTQRSESGIGLWSDEKYNAYEKGKIYVVDHTFNWSGVMVAYVVDEDGCSGWAMPQTFKPVKS